MQLFGFTVLFTLLSFFSYQTEGLSEKCRKGPNYWCKNSATAKECGAKNFCMFEKQSTNKIKFEPSERKAVAHQLNNASPVNVTLYYESLCPDCKQTIMYQLFPTFMKLASSGILNIELVPYGNAQERLYGGSWIFYCQHGLAECTGNVIESCIIKHSPDQNVFMPVIHCLEYYGPTFSNLPYCASLGNISATVISECAQGAEGNGFQHEMAVKTEALNPPHQYVPWFMMNGQHSNTIQQQLSSNMLNFVCSSYTGTKPAACSSRKRVGACYKEQ